MMPSTPGGSNPSVTAIPASASVPPAKATPKDPLADVVDLDGDGDNGRMNGGGDSNAERKEEINGGGGMFPMKKRRRDDDVNNFHNFVGHEIIDGEDEDDGKGRVLLLSLTDFV